MNRKVTSALLAVVALGLAVTLVVLLTKNKAADRTTSPPAATTTDNSPPDMRPDSGQQSATGDASTVPAPTRATIDNFAFNPAVITVKKGTTVIWTNNDSAEHTVTAEGGDGPASDFLGRGKSYSYTFNTVGTYRYYCKPHPSMKGTITVTE